ncbi:MAG: hypothetical protein ACJAYF_001915 [Arenicella sp.]
MYWLADPLIPDPDTIFIVSYVNSGVMAGMAGVTIVFKGSYHRAWR